MGVGEGLSIEQAGMESVLRLTQLPFLVKWASWMILGSAFNSSKPTVSPCFLGETVAGNSRESRNQINNGIRTYVVHMYVRMW